MTSRVAAITEVRRQPDPATGRSMLEAQLRAELNVAVGIRRGDRSDSVRSDIRVGLGEVRVVQEIISFRSDLKPAAFAQFRNAEVLR